MDNLYESDKLLSEYLHFHFGDPQEVLPWSTGPTDALDYAVRCVTECFNPEQLGPESRALDIGCAVGRSAMELARHCGEVIGIDFSHRFVEAAAIIARDGSMDYEYVVEGERTAPAKARLPEGVDRQRLKFEQGDAMNLRADLGSFDAVLAANLICRLPKPEAFLSRCPELVRPGGMLVINTPFTWLGDYTPPDRWLGGRPETGESRDVLIARLSESFTCEGIADMPFLIREHRRKYQWSVAQSLRFRRNP